MERFNQHVKDWNCRNDVLHCINKSIDCYGDADAVELKLLLNKTENFVKSYYGSRLQWHEFKNHKNPLLSASKKFNQVTERYIEKDRLVPVGANDEKDEFICDGERKRKWYYCHGQKTQRSPVDAKSLNHCGEQLGYDLISLRDVITIDGVDYWKCYVTVSYDKQEKVISQFKGMMNSKVPTEYYRDLYRLIKFVHSRYGFKGVCGIGYHDNRNTSVDELMLFFKNEPAVTQFLEPFSTYSTFRKILTQRYGKLKFRNDEDVFRDAGVFDYVFISRLLRDPSMEPIRKDVILYMKKYVFGFYEMLRTTKNLQFMESLCGIDEVDKMHFTDQIRTLQEFDTFAKLYGFGGVRKSTRLKFLGLGYLKLLKELDLAEEQALPYEMIKLYNRCTPQDKKVYRKLIQNNIKILNKECLHLVLCNMPKEERVTIMKVFGIPCVENIE